MGATNLAAGARKHGADAINLGALMVALAAAMTGVAALGHAGKDQAPRVEMHAAPVEDVTELVDTRGDVVPVASYQRVVSLNIVADHVLLRLLEPQRLLAVSDSTVLRHPERWRFGDRPGVSRAGDVEMILGLRPDLVIVSKFTSEPLVMRLREAGVAVFDLGEMRGVATTRDDIRTLGTLLDVPERAAALEREFVRQLAALDVAVPDEHMPAGIYLNVIGDSFFGGTAGSSYADMLHYAGVRDVAAEHGYRDWPRYGAEQLLAMSPALIVTQEGMGAVLCSHSILRALPACGEGGRIVEVPGSYHSDPGLGLVQAAQSIQDLVHPQASRVLASSPTERAGPA